MMVLMELRNRKYSSIWTQFLLCGLPNEKIIILLNAILNFLLKEKVGLYGKIF